VKRHALAAAAGHQTVVTTITYLLTYLLARGAAREVATATLDLGPWLTLRAALAMATAASLGLRCIGMHQLCIRTMALSTMALSTMALSTTLVLSAIWIWAQPPSMRPTLTLTR